MRPLERALVDVKIAFFAVGAIVGFIVGYVVKTLEVAS